MDNNEYGRQIMELEDNIDNYNQNACNEIIESCYDYLLNIDTDNFDFELSEKINEIQLKFTKRSMQLIIASA